MKKMTINEIGTVNVENFEMAEGIIEMRMPIEVVSEEMEETLDKLFEYFKKDYPEVKDPVYEARLVFHFGHENPEFSMMIIVFDADDTEKMAMWDELKVTLSDEARKYFRKVAWDKLGEALFSM